MNAAELKSESHRATVALDTLAESIENLVTVSKFLCRNDKFYDDA